jgi:hypothetical protein
VFTPDGNSLIITTDKWIHQTRVFRGNLTQKASRLLPGSWTGAYRFLDYRGDKMNVAVHVTRDTIKIVTLNLNIHEADEIDGDEKELMEEWQRRLKQKLNERTGKIESMRPVEVPERRPGEESVRSRK